MTHIALGIDTGGTFTDAVLVAQETGEVIASAKTLTTYHHLAEGIARVIADVLDQAPAGVGPEQIIMASLSTTLATNAIVEGRGSPIALLLIGYDPELIDNYDMKRELVTENIRYIQGGHLGDGEEREPLDEDGVIAAVEAFQDQVDAFAISGYFSVLNPTHELRARALVRQHARRPDGSPMPVTCGHELSSRLNSVRRATTTALNARLIPLLENLIAAVQRTLTDAGIHAPLMVVKGDGSLVRASWAMQRPVETILSGPAASVVGAAHLSGLKDVWVVDMGGTTTDIAGLAGGQPRINPQGARVGRWQTMVEAIDMHTAGLGGDSQVQTTPGDASRDALQIGPGRVLPLCALADRYPAVLEPLRKHARHPERYRYPGQFAVAVRTEASGLPEVDRLILEMLADGPRSLDDLIYSTELGGMIPQRIKNLAAQFVVQMAAFTPTDALHVLGRFHLWDEEASRLGAVILVREAHLEEEAFCQRVVAGVSGRVGLALVEKILADEEGSAPDWEQERAARMLLERALHPQPDASLHCQARLTRPIVAIGAPVRAYLPQTAQILSTEAIIPPHAEVANAVGSVVASVVLRKEVRIQSQGNIDDQLYRALLSDGAHDFDELEEAVAGVKAVMQSELREEARRAGADQVEIKYQREDLVVPVQGRWGDELWLETILAFTAVGRPAVGGEKEEWRLGD